MNGTRGSLPDNLRLREIALILKRAFALSSVELPSSVEDIMMADMVLALDNPELRDILREIKELQEEQLKRLERLLSRHADNDP